MINYYAACSLKPTDNFKTIKSSLKALQAKYEKEITLGENVDALKSQLDIVIQAQETLLDADERETYDALLESTPPSAIVDPFADKYWDYASIRNSDLASWKDLVSWEGKINVDVYSQLLDFALELPFPDVQRSVVLAAILCPSAMANAMPILLGWGVSGCGKSRLSNLVSCIWGGNPVVGATTYAAIRREIAVRSKVTHNSKTYDLNHYLCWDDISSDILRNPQIESMFKSSTSRKTSQIKIAKGQSDTDTIVFDCFGGKFITSITPFFSEPQFVELARRMLVIECRKSSNLKSGSFESVDWGGLPEATNSYWEDREAGSRFIANRKEVTRYGKKFHNLAPERISLCSDLLTSGLTIGVWDDVGRAFYDLQMFYAHQDSLSAERKNPLTLIFGKYIDEAIKRAGSDSRPEIATNIIKDAVYQSLKFGNLDRRVNQGEMTEVMRSLGWELSVVERVWYKK